MQTGENEQALRKIMDFTRYLGILVLILHFYFSCYAAFAELHLTYPILNRILSNIYKLPIFKSILMAKSAALILLIASLIGSKGKKAENIRLSTAIIYSLIGVFLYYLSGILFKLQLSNLVIGAIYISVTTVGFLLFLTGVSLMFRIININLSTDIFNKDNETFPQEERKLENEYSINLPAQYNLKGKKRNSWINIINPFRGSLVAGINYLTDNFNEAQNSSFPLRSYNYQTVGGFVQNTWNAAPKFTIESGLRTDYHNAYGLFVLPRLSLLYKFNEHLTSRLGGGLGYKAPTVFTEDAERVEFRNVLPIDVANTKAERSYRANYDLNYRTGLFDNAVSLSINQLFFFTRINDPILLSILANGNLQYLQTGGDLHTQGMETNVKLTYGNFKLFLGYTLADVSEHIGNTFSSYPLVSKNRLNNVLVYEVENKFKIGAEAYYFSPQSLNDGTTGKGYWLAGLMAEKIWERFSLFINFENLTNTRQTKFGQIYTGNIGNPDFKDIYAPLDGLVVNGGVKFRLGN